MTVPYPPTSGPTSAQERLAAEDHGTPPDIQAPMEDLSAMAGQAEAAGNAWQAGAAKWADSPQGAGQGGFTLAGDKPSGADGSWNNDMSFGHEGP